MLQDVPDEYVSPAAREPRSPDVVRRERRRERLEEVDHRLEGVEDLSVAARGRPATGDDVGPVGPMRRFRVGKRSGPRERVGELVAKLCCVGTGQRVGGGTDLEDDAIFGRSYLRVVAIDEFLDQECGYSVSSCPSVLGLEIKSFGRLHDVRARRSVDPTRVVTLFEK